LYERCHAYPALTIGVNARLVPTFPAFRPGRSVQGRTGPAAGARMTAVSDPFATPQPAQSRPYPSGDVATLGVAPVKDVVVTVVAAEPPPANVQLSDDIVVAQVQRL
jgi:hypothetical protein